MPDGGAPSPACCRGRRSRDDRDRQICCAICPMRAAAKLPKRCSPRRELRVERIVSQGQASPPGFWYDQDEAEWVLLLAGAARLRFADEPQDRLLGPGDHVHIAPRRRHRVEWTDPAAPTVWLAVFHRP